MTIISSVIGQVGVIMKKYRHILSSPKALWYCEALVTNNPFIFWLTTLLFHFVPAYLADGVCLLMRKKRRYFNKRNKKANIKNCTLSPADSFGAVVKLIWLLESRVIGFFSHPEHSISYYKKITALEKNCMYYLYFLFYFRAAHLLHKASKLQ